MTFDFRGSDTSVTHDDRYDAPIYRYADTSEIPWDLFAEAPGQKVRIIIQPRPDILPLDMLYVPRDHPDLLVGLHGAVPREKQSVPVFQFVKSFRAKRKESLLFLSDPTLLQHEELRIGWMVGNRGRDVAPQYAELIQSLLHQTSKERAVLVGHSAGGTAAVRIGTQIPGSHAVSVNGQVSLEIHRAWDVNRLRRFVFAEYDTKDEMCKAYADRFDLRYALSSRVKGATFTWFSHPGDHLSFGDHPHFPAICEFFGLDEHGGVTDQGDSVLMTRYDSPSKNLHSLPGTVIPFVEAALGEETSLDLNVWDPAGARI